MSLYLIKSALCLLVLLAAYHFLLEKEKMFRFNRIYLLFSLVFSFVVPLLPLHNNILPQDSVQHLIADLRQSSAISNAANNNAEASAPLSASIPWTTIASTIYGLATFGLLLRFARNLYLIMRRIQANPKQRLGVARLVLVREAVVSHTFFNSIFVNEEEFNAGRIEPEVMMHELAHVRQRHTLDILLIEALQVILWFNPILMLYRRAIQLNHEFLADEAVVEESGAPKEYQYLLLQKVGPASHLALSSALNYRITKKRLIMIAKNTNAKDILIKKIILAPLLAIALFVFSSSINAQESGEPHPYVEIDGKEYPSDILKKISPSCERSSSSFLSKEAVKRYGPKAADGAVIITTFNGITYITPTELANLELEKAAKTGFYHRLVLKKEDGTEFDKLIVNFNNGSASSWVEHGRKVVFMVDKKIYREDQAGEVERLTKAMTHPGVSGVSGNNPVVFFFNSKGSLQ